MAKKNKRKKRIWIAASAIFVIAVIACAVTGFYLYKKSVVPRNAIVELPEGADYGVLLDTLRSGGKIESIGLFELFARARKLDISVKQGHYELKEGMTADEVVLLLRSGNQTPVNITFNNLRTLHQFAGRLGEQLKADSVEFAAVLTDSAVAAEYGFTPETFISMFIPNTYQVYTTTSPAALLDRMRREYDKFWSERDEKIAATGLKSREEVATIASIIEEESKKVSEYPTIAGVYINRVKRGIPLQADPTIIFAVGDPDLRRVRFRHLEVESPYNTYKYSGVPPGPIRMPSIVAIDAVLNYEQHDYLFFCAKPDLSGYHSFARTLYEHNKNADAYAAALDSMGIY